MAAGSSSTATKKDTVGESPKTVEWDYTKTVSENATATHARNALLPQHKVDYSQSVITVLRMRIDAMINAAVAQARRDGDRVAFAKCMGLCDAVTAVLSEYENYK